MFCHFTYFKCGMLHSKVNLKYEKIVCVNQKGFALKNWAHSFPCIHDMLSSDRAMGSDILKSVQLKGKEESTNIHVETMLCSSVEKDDEKKRKEWCSCRVMADEELDWTWGYICLLLHFAYFHWIQACTKENFLPHLSFSRCNSERCNRKWAEEGPETSLYWTRAS